jgi:hypothetical protein
MNTYDSKVKDLTVGSKEVSFHLYPTCKQVYF